MDAISGVTNATDSFLRNSWYVAGYSRELGDGALLVRTILSQRLLLFRDEHGRAAAILDRCPHRFAPLSLGQLDAGRVHCSYHGLAFDRTGQCVHNPHGSTAGLAVPAYPLEERQGLLWVWMGDPERADPALVPFDGFDETTCHVRSGYLYGEAHYELMTDNILDLSHIEYLHPALGTEAVSKAKVEVAQKGNTLITTRRMRDEVLRPGLAYVYRSGDQRVNRTMQVTWLPAANMILDVSIEPVDPTQNWRTGAQTLHLFTPATAQATHYFYVTILPRETADAERSDRFFDAVSRAFMTEDKPMIDAQAAMLGGRDIMELKPALFPTDKAPVLARRTLARLIAEETAERSDKVLASA